MSAVTAPAEERANPVIPFRAWLILALMTFDYVLGMIDRNTVSILKTTLKAEFSLTDPQYSILVTAFLVPYAIFYPICGRLVDRFGSRSTFTAFVAIWSLATIAAGFAQTFEQLVLTRIVLGAAEAGLLPATIYSLVRWFPRAKLATVYAIKNPLQALGPIAAPPLIVYLALGYGWRAAFIIPGVVSLVFAMFWWFADRNPPDYGEAPVVSEAAKPGLLALLRNRALVGILAARFVTDPVWFFFQNWQAGYLQERLGYSLAQVGSLLWIPPVVNMAAVFVTAAWSDRMIKRGVVPVQSRLRVVGWVTILAPAIAILPFVRSPLPVVALLTITYILGFTWLYLSNIMMADLFPKGQVASAVGLVNFFGTAGAALFNFLVGSYIEDFGYLGVFLFLALLYPTGAFILWRFYGRGASGPKAEKQGTGTPAAGAT